MCVCVNQENISSLRDAKILSYLCDTEICMVRMILFQRYNSFSSRMRNCHVQ